MSKDTPEAQALAESLKAYEDAVKATKGEPAVEVAKEAAPEVEVETKEPVVEGAAEEVAEVVKASPAVESKAKEKHRGDPVAAIVTLRKHNQMLHEELMMARGQNEALSKVALAKREESAPAAPKKDRLAEIEEEILASADATDAGEKTVREHEALRMKLEREARKLEYAALEKPAASQEQAPTEDLYLAEKTEELAKEYPFFSELTAEELEPFHKKAFLFAELHDEPIGTGPRETLRLRRIMCELAAQKYQPDGAKKPAADSSADEKRAALEAKLKVQEGAPPNVSKIGSGGASAGLSDSEFQAKYLAAESFEDAQLLMKQMPATLRKKLGL